MAMDWNKVKDLLVVGMDNEVKAAQLVADGVNAATARVELLKIGVRKDVVSKFVAVFRAYKAAMCQKVNGKAVEVRDVSMIQSDVIRLIGSYLGDNEKAHKIDGEVWKKVFQGISKSDLLKYIDKSEWDEQEAEKAANKVKKAKEKYLSTLNPAQRAIALLRELREAIDASGVSSEWAIKTAYPELFKVSAPVQPRQLVGQQS